MRGQKRKLETGAGASSSKKPRGISFGEAFDALDPSAEDDAKLKSLETFFERDNDEGENELENPDEGDDFENSGDEESDDDDEGNESLSEIPADLLLSGEQSTLTEEQTREMDAILGGKKRNPISRRTRYRKVPPYVAGLIGRGNQLFTDGKFLEAQRVLFEAVRQAPRITDAYASLAAINECMGNKKKAFWFKYLQATTSPSEHYLWRELAVASLQEGALSRALFMLNRWLRVKYDDTDAHQMRVQLCKSLGRYSRQQLASQRQILDHDPSLPSLLVYARALAENDRTAEAIQVLEDRQRILRDKYSDTFRQQLGPLRLLSGFYIDEQRHADNIVVLNDAVRKYSDESNVKRLLPFLVQSLYTVGRADDAQSLLEDLLEWPGTLRNDLLALGSALKTAGFAAVALRVYAEAFSRSSSAVVSSIEAPALLSASLLASEEGDTQLAIEYASRALKHSPDSSEIRLHLADLYRKTNNIDAAVHVLGASTSGAAVGVASTAPGEPEAHLSPSVSQTGMDEIVISTGGIDMAPFTSAADTQQPATPEDSVPMTAASFGLMRSDEVRRLAELVDTLWQHGRFGDIVGGVYDALMELLSSIPDSYFPIRWATSSLGKTRASSLMASTLAESDPEGTDDAEVVMEDVADGIGRGVAATREEHRDLLMLRAIGADGSVADDESTASTSGRVKQIMQFPLGNVLNVLGPQTAHHLYEKLMIALYHTGEYAKGIQLMRKMDAVRSTQLVDANRFAFTWYGALCMAKEQRFGDAQSTFGRLVRSKLWKSTGSLYFLCNKLVTMADIVYLDMRSTFARAFKNAPGRDAAILCGNCSQTTSKIRPQLRDFLTAYEMDPEYPSVLLSIAASYMDAQCSRVALNRHRGIQLALVFMGMFAEKCHAEGRPYEGMYNLARLMQQAGLNSHAAKLYEAVLDCSDDGEDAQLFKRLSAHNVAGMYSNMSNQVARQLVQPMLAKHLDLDDL